MYTASERVQRAVWTARAIRQAAAGASTAKFDRRLDASEQRALDRRQRDADAALALVATARLELAKAKAKERAAKRDERPDARKARIEAQDTLKRAERAARRYV